MRLIHTTSIKLTEFVGTKFPPYVILSHTWGVGEVLYSDIQDGTAPDKNGYAKLLGCCKKAREDGYDWAWIDTCCIDKTSSAELSEAINSMFAWYRDADICYAYLQDVSDGWPVSNIPGSQSQRFRSRVDDFDPFLRTSPERLATPTFPPSDYCQSKWFTRGWTLQELIAPRAVEFYTAKWEEVGTKAALAAEVSSTTGIPVRILRGDKLTSCNVAERLSWASARKTTRVEDMAYSLLGLFGISMPLLYGEGVKSFVRLQQHILEQEEDYSILTWVPQYDSPGSLTGCLASAPSEFARTALQHLDAPILPGHPGWNEQFIPRYEKYLLRDLPATKSYDQLSRGELGKVHSRALGLRGTHDPPRLTSRGLRISLFMKPLNVGPSSTNDWIAWTYYELQGQLICILLRSSSKWPDLFGRHSTARLTTVDKALFKEFEQQEIFLYPNGNISGIDPGPEFYQAKLLSPMGRLRVATSCTGSYPTYAVSFHPTKRWGLDKFFFLRKPDIVGVIVFETIYGDPLLPNKDRPRSRFEVACGFHNELAWCNISEELRSLDGMDEDALTSAFKRRHAKEDEAFDDLTDRAARRFTHMPGVIISAKIRQRSAEHANCADYTLKVRASEEGYCERWMDLCLARKALANVDRQAEVMA